MSRFKGLEVNLNLFFKMILFIEAASQRENEGDQEQKLFSQRKGV